MGLVNYWKLSAESAQALMSLEKAIHAGSIEKSLIDLVKIRASQINGCALCVDMHVKQARIDHERELRLHHLVVWHESPLFSEREKAALEWTEKVTKLANGVSMQDFEKARTHFSEQEISDLTFVVVAINAWNRLGVSFHGVPGSFDKMMGLEKAGLS